MKNSNISRGLVLSGIVVALAISGCGDANYKKAREQIDANPLNANLSEEQKDKLAKQMAEAQAKVDEAAKQVSGK